MNWPLTLSSLVKSKRAGERPTCSRLNSSISSSVEKISWSPWLQPSRSEVVAQRLRQVAHGAVGLDAERPVALRQLGAVGPVDQRDMGQERRRPAERLVDLDLLAGGIGQVVVAADNVGDAHVVIVDDHREHVGRRAVGAQDDQVVEILVLDARCGPERGPRSPSRRCRELRKRPPT
jgi:hypothetical protein